MATKPTFQELRAEYAQLWSTLTIEPRRVSAVDRVVTKIMANTGRYTAVQQQTTVPWYVVAVIHSLESSLNFKTHLHNGDPLSARTTHVPAGHPRAGHPPFTWEVSAADALKLSKLDENTDWSIERIAYLLESYNGWGYRLHHPNVKSPYLWSFSNHYVMGKYVADGQWSATAVSEQCGAMVLLKRLEALGDIVLAPSASPPPPTAPEENDMAASWRMAAALTKYLAQINALAPNRDKSSDGGIGDARHAAGKSEHNPEDHDSDPSTPGVVRAYDITHDPAGGCDCNVLAASLKASRDPRILYMIWNRKITSSVVQPWVDRDYTGPNPHTTYLHLSVSPEVRRFDDARSWAIRVKAGATTPATTSTQTTNTVSAPGTGLEARPGAGTAVATSGATAVGLGAFIWNAFGWLGLATFIVAVIALLWVFRKPIGRLLFKKGNANGTANPR